MAKNGEGVSKKRIVVKIGSSVILEKTGKLNHKCMSGLVGEMSGLHKNNDVIIVTSGAIGMGKSMLGIKQPKDLSGKQALAAVGQANIIQVYQSLFNKYKIWIAQVLLTREDLQDRQRYLNVRNTLLRLLEYKVIPVINENDTVAVDEIKFGDNDTLSALVASKMDADLLIMLSDVEGIYKDFESRKNIIHEIQNQDIDSVDKYVKPTVSVFGVGGSGAKISAAKIACKSGITSTAIAKGDEPGIIMKIVSEMGKKEKKTGTWFMTGKKLSGKKRWIAFNAEVKGAVTVDEGADKALKKGGKSLLPSGIIGVEGQFESGDVVQVRDTEGKEFARGVSNYSSRDLKKIAGKKTTEITSVFGRKNYDEAIHCDNLVMI